MVLPPIPILFLVTMIYNTGNIRGQVKISIVSFTDPETLARRLLCRKIFSLLHLYASPMCISQNSLIRANRDGTPSSGIVDQAKIKVRKVIKVQLRSFLELCNPPQPDLQIVN